MLPFVSSAFLSLSAFFFHRRCFFPCPHRLLPSSVRRSSSCHPPPRCFPSFLRLFVFICVLFFIAGAFSLARIVFCLRRFGGRRLAILLQDASLRFFRLFVFICVLFFIAGALSLARIVFCLRRFGGRRLAILL